MVFKVVTAASRTRRPLPIIEGERDQVMAHQISDVNTQLAFSEYEGKGVFAVLLGSGLSRAAGIPTGWEITLDLIRRVGLAQNIKEQPDWAEWYRQKPGWNRIIQRCWKN
jgi:hypothetical protein